MGKMLFSQKISLATLCAFITLFPLIGCAGNPYKDTETIETEVGSVNVNAGYLEECKTGRNPVDGSSKPWFSARACWDVARDAHKAGARAFALEIMHTACEKYRASSQCEGYLWGSSREYVSEDDRAKALRVAENICEEGVIYLTGAQDVGKKTYLCHVGGMLALGFRTLDDEGGAFTYSNRSRYVVGDEAKARTFLSKTCVERGYAKSCDLLRERFAINVDRQTQRAASKQIAATEGAEAREANERWVVQKRIEQSQAEEERQANRENTNNLVSSINQTTLQLQQQNAAVAQQQQLILQQQALRDHARIDQKLESAAAISGSGRVVGGINPQQEAQRIASFCNSHCAGEASQCNAGSQSGCYRAAACQCQCFLDADTSNSPSRSQWRQCVTDNKARANELDDALTVFDPNKKTVLPEPAKPVPHETDACAAKRAQGYACWWRSPRRCETYPSLRSCEKEQGPGCRMGWGKASPAC